MEGVVLSAWYDQYTFFPPSGSPQPFSQALEKLTNQSVSSPFLSSVVYSASQRLEFGLRGKEGSSISDRKMKSVLKVRCWVTFGVVMVWRCIILGGKGLFLKPSWSRWVTSLSKTTCANKNPSKSTCSKFNILSSKNIVQMTYLHIKSKEWNDTERTIYAMHTRD